VTLDELFLFTLADLEERAEMGKGEYDALLMAALLRKLLLDEVPLVHAVNPDRRERLRFHVTDLSPPEGVEGWSLDDVFHPSGASPEHSTVELRLDQLLRRTAVVAFGEHVSVRELIKFLAHSYGAVHAFPADTPTSRALRDEAWSARITTPKGQYSGPVYSLVAIARVILDGLQPLRARVEAETPNWRRGLGRHEDPTQRDL